MLIKLEQIENGEQLKKVVDNHGSSSIGEFNFATEEEIKALIPEPEPVLGTLKLTPNMVERSNIRYLYPQPDGAIERGSKAEIPWDIVDCSDIETSLKYVFSFDSDLKVSPKLINTSKIKSLYGLYEDCYRLFDVKPFENIDECVCFDYAFESCKSLGYFYVEFPKTKQPVSCRNMFLFCNPDKYYGEKAVGLLKAPDIKFQIKDATYMFDNCTALTTVPEYDLSKCEYMDGMFMSCKSLGHHEYSTEDEGVFPWVIDCSSLKKVPDGMFLDTQIKKVQFKNVPESILQDFVAKKIFGLTDKDDESQYTIEIVNDSEESE